MLLLLFHVLSAMQLVAKYREMRYITELKLYQPFL